jgi:hypothetical protein
MLFLSLIATLALGTSLVTALPSSDPVEGGLEARHTCPSDQFWYSQPQEELLCEEGGRQTWHSRVRSSLYFFCVEPC